jgi:hypothetical protein
VCARKEEKSKRHSRLPRFVAASPPVETLCLKEKKKPTMPASAVCCLDLKGRILLARDYRGDVPLRLAERFWSRLAELEEGAPRPPVVLMDGATERERGMERRERREGGRALSHDHPP